MNPRAVFTLDACGAAVSALLLGIVLPALQPHLGAPRSVFYGLAGLAVAFLLYDLGCLLAADLEDPRWLQGIISANAAYCLLSGGLAVHHGEHLTGLGVAWFSAEIVVLLALVVAESRWLLQIRAARATDGPFGAA